MDKELCPWNNDHDSFLNEIMKFRVETQQQNQKEQKQIVRHRSPQNIIIKKNRRLVHERSIEEHRIANYLDQQFNPSFNKQFRLHTSQETSTNNESPVFVVRKLKANLEKKEGWMFRRFKQVVDSANSSSSYASNQFQPSSESMDKQKSQYKTKNKVQNKTRIQNCSLNSLKYEQVDTDKNNRRLNDVLVNGHKNIRIKTYKGQQRDVKQLKQKNSLFDKKKIIEIIDQREKERDEQLIKLFKKHKNSKQNQLLESIFKTKSDNQMFNKSQSTFKDKYLIRHQKHLHYINTSVNQQLKIQQQFKANRQICFEQKISPQRSQQIQQNV